MIYLPLEHIENRYTTHLDRDVREYLGRRGIPYTCLEPVTVGDGPKDGMFLDGAGTVYRQLHQMQELIGLLVRGEVSPDETLFVTDIWNFALLAIPYLNFFAGYNLKVRGVLHAGSFTDTDFVRRMERVYKGFEESLFDICERIYVGSNFIREDVLSKRYVQPDRLVVTGLPLDLVNLGRFRREGQPRSRTVVFAARNVDEKQPYLFDLLRKRLPQYEYINTQRMHLSKESYYNVLSRARCIVSFALQENFGYAVQEAVSLGCVPVLPNRLAYVEQFGREYLYDSFDECVEKVRMAMENELPRTVPTVTDNDRIFDVWFKDL